MADATSASPGMDPPTDPPGEVLAGRYVIERQLGHGGMATVYLARDLKHDCPVAVKVLSPDLAFAVGPRRFLREIEITAALQYPSIVPVLDSGTADDLPFYVMPFLAGGSLRARLVKEPQLSVDDAVRIAVEVADALTYAHAQEVIHRDIKPENILFSGGRPCVADFGIAQAIQRAGGDRLTSTGMVPGTPAYVSPEQAAGERELDGRSDQYSLACVVYEMLAGFQPFVGPTAESVIAQRFLGPPRPIRKIRVGVPEHIERGLDRAMSIAPADRYAGTKEFAQALAAPPPTAAPPKPPAAPRTSLRRWIAGAVAIAAVAALGIAAWMKFRPGSVGGNANPDRVVVLPPGGEGGKQRTTPVVQRELYDAFRRWRDLDLVDYSTVAQFVPGPVPDKAAPGVARHFGAGRLVQATMTPHGDSVRIDAAIYDVKQQRRSREYSLMVADSRAAASDAYRQMVAALLGDPEAPPAFDPGDGGTSSIAAWRAYQRGVASLTRWELATAERELAQATTTDPAYPQAQLWLGQVGSWRRDTRPDTWLEPASRAVAGNSRLSAHDRVLAEALLALARRQFGAACSRYQRLVDADSSDVVAWFGRGECLTKDATVVRDARSPSGWRFVTSRQAAIDAFQRALELAPDAQPVLGLERRKGLLYATTNVYRPGYASPRDSFAAPPSLDVRGDTIVFVPVPFAAFAAGNPRAMPPTLGAAIQRHRDILLTLARKWVGRHPNDADANEALAYALEVRGDIEGSEGGGASAIAALRAARAASDDPEQRLRLVASEIRVHVKRSELDAARALADSILAGVNPSPENASQLAGLAALTGRAGLAGRLLYIAASANAGINGGLFGTRAPEQVRAPAAVLMAHAALGACDSVRAQIARVERAIEANVEPAGREAVWYDVVPRSLSLAAPCDSGRALAKAERASDRLMLMQQALARGDLRTLRAHFDTLQRTRTSDRPGDVAIDYTLQEAWLLATVGDTAQAIRRLDHALDGLSTLGDYVVEFVPQAAALGRTIALRVAIASQTGDKETASRWTGRLRELWRNADPDVRDSAVR